MSHDSSDESVKERASENPTNGAVLLVTSPVLVHVVNASATECQLLIGHTQNSVPTNQQTMANVSIESRNRFLYIENKREIIVFIFIGWYILLDSLDLFPRFEI